MTGDPFDQEKDYGMAPALNEREKEVGPLWQEWLARTLRSFLPPGFPTIVTLCGSTRFADAYRRASRDETLAGKIVLSVGLLGHAHERVMTEDGCMGPREVTVNVVSDSLSVTPEQKAGLDELHLRKIDMSDEVLFLNVGGYLGESSRRELAYARRLGKAVRFLEPETREQ